MKSLHLLAPLVLSGFPRMAPVWPLLDQSQQADKENLCGPRGGRVITEQTQSTFRPWTATSELSALEHRLLSTPGLDVEAPLLELFKRFSTN